MTTHRILIVDDDSRVRRTLSQALESDGFETKEAKDAEEMMRAVERTQFDAITLDLTLPDEDGLSLARRLRHVSDVPIVMITAKTDPVDRIIGLELGADDYICKPFHLREAVARLRAVIRRRDLTVMKAASTDHQRRLTFEGWILDVPSRTLTRQGGDEVELTGMEFELLAFLAMHPGEALSRDTISERLKGRRWSPFDRCIDMQVRRLRQKIETNPARPRLIKTVRGLGYLFAGSFDQSSRPGDHQHPTAPEGLPQHIPG